MSCSPAASSGRQRQPADPPLWTGEPSGAGTLRPVTRGRGEKRGGGGERKERGGGGGGRGEGVEGGGRREGRRGEREEREGEREGVVGCVQTPSSIF